MKTLISEIKQKLGIEGGIYIDAEIEDAISHIDRSQYFEFFKSLSGEYSFLKPMDRIAKVADKYRPAADNQNEAEAERLIEYCRAVNNSVFDDSQKYKTQFSDLIQKLKLQEMVSPMDYSILSNVKPYCNALDLIANINCFENSSVQLKAFVSALAYKDNVMSIESIKRRKMILRTAK